MMYAAPTMAAPVQYGAAPMAYGTTTMAAPMAYAAAPMAAPMTYAAPTMVETVAAAPSYANYAQPMSYAPQMVETVAAAPQYANYAQPAYANYAQPMSYAAPMVETVAAAPQYATYAAPMSYAAPMVETMAAPMSYAAPYTTQAPSYVAAPVAMQQMTYAPQQMYAAPQQMIAAPQVPIQPVKLTEGCPTPEQIAQQKAGYSAALDKQLKDAIDTVTKETQIEKEMIKFTADKNIALQSMQVDERLIEAMCNADEQATFALLELNKAKVERNLQLSAQANGLVMDYQMKAIQTELAEKQYAFQVTYMQKEGALQQQYNQQVAQANTGTTYSVR